MKRRAAALWKRAKQSHQAVQTLVNRLANDSESKQVSSSSFRTLNCLFSGLSLSLSLSSSSNDQESEQPIVFTLADVIESLMRGGVQRPPITLYPDSLGDDCESEVGYVAHLSCSLFELQ